MIAKHSFLPSASDRCHITFSSERAQWKLILSCLTESFELLQFNHGVRVSFKMNSFLVENKFFLETVSFKYKES